MYWWLAFRSVWYCFLEALFPINPTVTKKPVRLTIFWNTHLFSTLSGRLHWYSAWLPFSRHCQCALNSSRQCSFTSFRLGIRSVSLVRTIPVVVRYLHARCTPGHFPSLPHTIQFSPPICLGFALHVVVVICSTSCTDKEGSTE